MANDKKREFTLTFNMDAPIELEQIKSEPTKTIQKFILGLRKVMNADPRIRSIRACHVLFDNKGDRIGQWSIENNPYHYELHSALRVLRDKFATSNRPLIKHTALTAIAALEFLIEMGDESLIHFIGADLITPEELDALRKENSEGGRILPL